MRILPSSPYADFVSKDWNSCKNTSRFVAPDSAAKIKKKYYKNYVRFEIQESPDNEIKEKDVIQLSFA
tara:strand:- start:72 stop:275 length:204 start_codon:yes stop_codon:yes gene_type:complete